MVCEVASPELSDTGAAGTVPPPPLCFGARGFLAAREGVSGEAALGVVLAPPRALLPPVGAVDAVPVGAEPSVRRVEALPADAAPGLPDAAPGLPEPHRLPTPHLRAASLGRSRTQTRRPRHAAPHRSDRRCSPAYRASRRQLGAFRPEAACARGPSGPAAAAAPSPASRARQASPPRARCRAWPPCVPAAP